MRLDLTGLKRSLTSRPLSYEPLEKRALLTSLIAAVDLAPGPVSEFTAQARMFVESALEQVMVLQHQTPVRSTVDSLTQVAEDGQTVRITNYTVELDPSVDHGRTQFAIPGNSNAGHSLSQVNSGVTRGLVATMSDRSSISVSRSSLIFSFMIFADNSVSIRARLSNPVQWAGLGIGQSKEFARADRLTPSDNDSAFGISARPTTTPPRPLSFNLAVTREISQDGLEESSTLDEQISREHHTRADRHGRMGRLDEELIGEAMGRSTLLDQWNELEMRERTTQSNQRAQPGVAAPMDQPSLPAETQLDSDWRVTRQSDMDSIPVPLGMVQLEFVQIASGHHAKLDISSHASALYQIFVHAVDRVEPQVLLVSGQRVPGGKDMAHSTDDEHIPSRGESSTLVIALLTSSLALTRRRKRSEQDWAANVARTSAVPG